MIRAPASGAKIKKADYPDVVAIKDGKVAVFEVKSRRETKSIYLEKEQVRKLLTFAERAGGRAYVAVKIPHKGWRFIKAETLDRTPKGRYKVSKDQVNNAPTLAGVLADLGLIKDLTNFLKGNDI